MITLLVGVLLVVLSAAGFGFALFGHRPIPQPAMSGAAPHPADVHAAEPVPRTGEGGSTPDFAAPTHSGESLKVGRIRAMLQREPSAAHQPDGDAALSPLIRLRSAVVLLIVSGGIAALVGVSASIVLVAAVLLLT